MSILTNGEFGAMAALKTGIFTQADLDAMTADPELLIGWFFGLKTLPSGIVKKSGDKVYYPIKNIDPVNKYLTSPSAKDSSGMTSTRISNSEYVVENKTGTNNLYPQISFQFGTQKILGDVKVTIKVISGKITKSFNLLGSNLPHTQDYRTYLDKDYSAGETAVISIKSMQSWKYSGMARVYCDSSHGPYKINVKIEAITTHVAGKILGGGVDIIAVGNSGYSAVSPHGIQGLLLKENKDGVPVGLIKPGEIMGGSDGRYVQLPLVDHKLQKHLVTKCLSEIKGDITQVVDTVCPTKP